jgi:hypothetical protein
MVPQLGAVGFGAAGAGLAAGALIKTMSDMYRQVLDAFLRDHLDHPRAWQEQPAFSKSRAPLNEAADKAREFFNALHANEMAVVNPWKAARDRLRENPNASLLRELVAEHAGLLADPDDPRPQPA